MCYFCKSHEHIYLYCAPKGILRKSVHVGTASFPCFSLHLTKILYRMTKLILVRYSLLSFRMVHLNCHNTKRNLSNTVAVESKFQHL